MKNKPKAYIKIYKDTLWVTLVAPGVREENVRAEVISGELLIHIEGHRASTMAGFKVESSTTSIVLMGEFEPLNDIYIHDGLIEISLDQKVNLNKLVDKITEDNKASDCWKLPGC